MPIKSFRHKGLRRFVETCDSRGLPPTQVRKPTHMLTLLETAQAPEDMGLFPGWRLHRLSGNLAGFSSLAVTGNWRLVFRMEAGHAIEVDLIDYH